MSFRRSEKQTPYRDKLGRSSEPPRPEPALQRSWRGSLLDPVVIAAFVTILGGGVTFVAGNDDAQQRHSAEMQAKKDEGICNRAFDFLQDEAVNPRLEKDDAFYKSQREIAERCSGKGKSQ